MKDFTQHTEALELKQLRFNEPCFKFYIETGELFPASYSKEGTVYPSNSDLLPEWTASPTYSQAFRWFREKYGIGSWIHHYFDMDKGIFIYSYVLTLPHRGEEYVYDTYEEAEKKCLIKLIEIVKGGNK